MTNDLDPNRIAADLFHRVLKDMTRSLSAPVRDLMNKLFDAMRRDLGKYIAATIGKCSIIKTPIINRDKPTYLFDIYVHTRLALKNKRYEDDDFISQLPNLKSVVITGNAGSGKSMFMRYLFLALCEKGFGRVPLFIELRNLNSITVKDLLAFTYHSIVGPGANLTLDQFETGLKNGAFSIILDGFDEIDFDQRKLIEDQILKLRENHPELLIIVSSRPDPERRFEAWSRFHVAYVEPMQESQVTDLIKKVDYDPKIKKQFLKSLRDGLFHTHFSFLSNPLLCLMMLVTFEQTGQIPDKRHVFYEHAFDALFFLHDSAKEGVYKRKTYANLPIDEFRNCLSAFCIVSYIKEQFTFSPSEMREVISQALKIEKKDANVKDFINDLIESTCLLQLDGVDYAFTHRSFQEYFAAYFIARSPATKLKQLLDQLAKRREDDVIPMAFAMNRHLLERDWIIPKLKEYLEISKSIDIDRDVIAYVEALFGPLGLQINRGKIGEFWYDELHSNGHVWNAFAILYPEKFSAVFKWMRRQQKVDAPLIQKAYDSLRMKNDPRLTSKANSGKNKVNSETFRLHLETEDNAWLRKTRLIEYYKRLTKIMIALLSEMERDMKNQADILETLMA